MLEALLWGTALLLVHTYFLYPALLAATGRRQRRGEAARAGSPGALPTVSLVVAAYNEEACLRQKLANSLALHYPQERFELLIGSDGSTDATEDIVRACADPRVRLSAGPRAGKASVLNRCLPLARGDIVVLSDANTHIAPEALEALVRPFEDPEVGAVCGRLRLYNPTKRDFEESAYWAYESFIKREEGLRGAVMGANGGLYAIRRSLFEPLPPSTIVDDFVIALRILARGHKVVYAAQAVAHEETTEDYGQEFRRRTRIAAGNFQSLALVPRLLSPSAGFAAYAFWSHKLLRWCAPALMVLAFGANLLLLGEPLYRVTMAAQAAFYLLALVGRWRGARLPRALARAASVASYFVTMNAAIAVGFWRFLRRRQGAAWERTARA